MIRRDELSIMEEFTYSSTPTLERPAQGGGSLDRRGTMERRRPEREGYSLGRTGTMERVRPERDSYTVDVRASDLQLAQAQPHLHPCLSYRAWLYSVLIGGSLLITAGFSLYLGNVFPAAMDYLRCAAGSGLPAAVVSLAVAKNRHVAVSDFQLMYVSTFAVTTACLVWFGCKLVLSPSAVNINFNLILMIVLEVLMAATVILAARSADDCCSNGKPVTYDRPVVLPPAAFPARLLRAYAVVEVMVGISAVVGGTIALSMDALLPGPYLSVTFFWILVACFPCAIASHVVSEYPDKCLVEMLMAITSVTSPLLFSASAFLTSSILSLAEAFQHHVPVAKQSYDLALVVLAGLLLVQAGLTLATAVHCASYKAKLRTGALEWHRDQHTPTHLAEQTAPNGTLQDFDKDRAWKAVLVQMAS